MGLALVFAGGDPPSAASMHHLPPADLVIAADSGVEHALALGCAVDLVVGDFDSADPAAVDAAVAGGAALERHPEAKDATDLELALVAARDRDARDVVVIGGAGGRLDHFLANLLLLASPLLADVGITARVGNADLTVVRDAVELHGSPGDLCSLLALGGPATGVVTDGLRFPLDRETLLPGSTRGISNELLEPSARVTVAGGVLLAVLPQARKDS
jgi:thiamine pyrophosphokinase